MENQENYAILGGKAYVFRRDDSKYWYAATYLNGHNYRHSTKEEQLHNAIQFAEDCYISLRGNASVGLLQPPQGPEEQEPQEMTFREVADQFIKEYSVITEGQRSPRWIEGHAMRLRVHLLPFFGDFPISAVSSGKVQEYRVMRIKTLNLKLQNGQFTFFSAYARSSSAGNRSSTKTHSTPCCCQRARSVQASFFKTHSPDTGTICPSRARICARSNFRPTGRRPLHIPPSSVHSASTLM